MRDRHVQQLQATIQTNNELMARKDQEITRKDQEMARKDEEIAAKDGRVQQLQYEVEVKATPALATISNTILTSTPT